MTNILSFFPQHQTPRPVQIEALLKVQECWDKSDVVVVNLPVATGKSSIAVTIARWAASLKLKSVITTPNNLLVDQYLRDFKQLPYLKRDEFYICHTHQFGGQPYTCAKIKKVLKGACKGCICSSHQRRAYVVPYLVCNSYMYMARKLHKDVLIADEAHSLIDFIRDLNSKHVWADELGLPSWVKTYGALHKFLLTRPALTANQSKLLEELESNKTRYIISRGTKLHYGEEKDALLMSPVDVRDSAPVFWPKKVKKLVLLSATINRKDIELMGLDKRRVTFLEATSPISPERRPVYLDCSLSLNYQALQNPASIQKLAECIEWYVNQHPDERGVVHVTYSLSERLKPLLSHLPRLIWHTKETKQRNYKLFLNTPGAVLMASGMYEGIDLPEDLGRWQLITKCPWPSLADPAVKYLADTDSEWYAWQTAKTILQGTGRVCRSPADYGETVILDKSFLRLYQDYQELFPGWWKQAVRQGDTDD